MIAEHAAEEGQADNQGGGENACGQPSQEVHVGGQRLIFRLQIQHGALAQSIAPVCRERISLSFNCGWRQIAIRRSQIALRTGAITSKARP